MAFSTDFVHVGRLAEVVGLPAALTLAGFFGKAGQRIRVPVSTDDTDHILVKVIGADAFKKLVDTHPGEYLAIPEIDLSVLRRAGLIYRLSRRQVPIGDIALAAGCGLRTVHQIKSTLRLEGLADLADTLPDDGFTDSEGGEL